jgi:hypothetical protein
MLTAIAGAVPAASAAQSCAQLNDRVFGSDGQGGQAAQFRALKAKIDAETGTGQTAAAAKDRAAYLKLATSILASAKTMQTSHCKSRIVAQASPETRVANVPQTPAITAGASARSPLSAHGCTGFDGRWNTNFGMLTIDGTHGTYRYAGGSLSGAIVGRAFTGQWNEPGINARGSFSLTLAADGDAFSGKWTSENGNSGPWNGTCAGG